MTSDATTTNAVLGLPVDALDDDCVPIKAVVSVVYLDAEGNIDTCHFATDGTQPYEAMGLISEHLAILNDQAPYVYFNIDMEDEDE